MFAMFAITLGWPPAELAVLILQVVRPFLGTREQGSLLLDVTRECLFFFVFLTQYFSSCYFINYFRTLVGT